MSPVLQGLKVVDLAGYIAGAYCPALLADFGAEVIKVEPLEGEAFRAIGGGFQGWNRGKRSIALDLSRPEGRDILYRLVQKAQVVVENFRHGVAERLGADYATLRKLNPRLIYCSVTGYGGSGPYQSKPGFDPLLQARSGAMAAQGGPGNPPIFLRVAITDYTAALLGACGIAAALVHLARMGQGQRVETCLLNAAFAVQAEEFFSYSGKVPSPRLDSLGLTPIYRLFKTSDGWLFLGCRNQENWSRLCQVIAMPALAANPRFASEERRAEHSRALCSILEPLFQRKRTATWLKALQRAAIPSAPANTTRDLFSHPHVLGHKMIAEHVSKDLGPLKQMGHIVGFSQTPQVLSRAAPALGEHTDEILAELGLPGAEVARLRGMQVVR